jgi:hypothetical protein
MGSLLVFDWLHSVGQSLLCNDAFKQGFSYFQSLLIQSYTSRRFCIDSMSEKLDPLYPFGRCDIPFGSSAVKASSVWTTRNFHPNLPLCPEASNCTRLHPSRHLNNTSGRLLVFDKSKDFFPKHRYGKTDATVRTMCVPVWTLSLIRQVVHTKFNRLDVILLGPDTQVLIWKLCAAEVQPSGHQSPWFGRSSLNMEIACNRSATVRTLGQHCPDASCWVTCQSDRYDRCIGYVSVTVYVLGFFLNSGYPGFGCPRVVFLLIEFPLHQQNICLFNFCIVIFCCTLLHTLGK